MLEYTRYQFWNSASSKFTFIPFNFVWSVKKSFSLIWFHVLKCSFKQKNNSVKRICSQFCTTKAIWEYQVLLARQHELFFELEFHFVRWEREKKRRRKAEWEGLKSSVKLNERWRTSRTTKHCWQSRSCSNSFFYAEQACWNFCSIIQKWKWKFRNGANKINDHACIRFSLCVFYLRLIKCCLEKRICEKKRLMIELRKIEKSINTI